MLSSDKFDLCSRSVYFEIILHVCDNIINNPRQRLTFNDVKEEKNVTIWLSSLCNIQNTKNNKIMAIDSEPSGRSIHMIYASTL